MYVRMCNICRKVMQYTMYVDVCMHVCMYMYLHTCTVYIQSSVLEYICASTRDCWMCVTECTVPVQVISSHMVLLFLFSYVMPNEKSEMHWTPAQFEELQLLVGPPCQLTYPHMHMFLQTCTHLFCLFQLFFSHTVFV